MAHYRVYGRAGAGSFAPEMLLTEMGQPYELVPISKEAAGGEAYLKICPTAMVPALGLPGGAVVWESAAICIHLTLAHPEAGLAPEPGSAEHARFLQWMAYLSSSLYQCCRRIYYAERYTIDGAADAEKVKAKAIVDSLEVYRLLEEALAERPGPWLLGDLSAADHYLFMLMTWFPEGEAGLLAAYPRLADLAGALRARPALQALIEENAGPAPAA